MSDPTPTLQFDPESIKNRIIANLVAGLEADYGLDSIKLLAFGTNMRIIQAISEEIAEAVRYDEYLTRETKWQIARNKSSIMTMASFFNYKPHRKVGSSGNLRVSSNVNFLGMWPNPISIRKFDSFSDNNLIFSAIDNFILLPSQNSIEIQVLQGIPTSVQFVISQGQVDANPTGYINLYINDPDFENTLYEVYVNGLLYTELTSIRLSTTGTDSVYTLKTRYDFSGVVIGFGNNIFGRALQVNDVVLVKYLKTKGDLGDVGSTNTITKPISVFYDSTSTAVTLYCKNEAAVTGGKAVETIESIRANAPLSYQTGQRAISKSDYIVLIKKTGYADYVTVWGESEYNIDNGMFPGSYVPNQENMVNVSGYIIDTITRRGTTITQAGQVGIRSELNLYKGPTDIIVFTDTQFVYLDFLVTAYVSDSRYSVAQVTANILDGLASEYDLSAFSFFTNLYFSQYYQFLNSIAGVNHHVTSISFTQYLHFASAYQFSCILNMDHILAGTVKFWYQHNNDGIWLQFAHDAAGVLVGEVGFQVPTASIYYTSGVVSGPGTNNMVNVTTGFTDGNLSNYQLKVTYQTDTAITGGDVILKKRFQVLSLGSSTVNILGM